MSFLVLECGAAIFALLFGLEMRRQRRPWRTALVGSLSLFAALTVMIAMWRGR